MPKVSPATYTNEHDTHFLSVADFSPLYSFIAASAEPVEERNREKKQCCGHKPDLPVGKDSAGDHETARQPQIGCNSPKCHGERKQRCGRQQRSKCQRYEPLTIRKTAPSRSFPLNAYEHFWSAK